MFADEATSCDRGIFAVVGFDSTTFLRDIPDLLGRLLVCWDACNIIAD